MNKYAHHVVSSAWRKKSSMLVASLALVLIIFGLHYNRNEADPEDPKPLVVEKRVNFVHKLSDYREVGGEKDQVKLTPKDYLIPNFFQQNEKQESLETDQQLGIPVVNSYSKNPYVPKHRIVHLDLKGAPPLLAFYKRFFPFVKNLGATGLLIEYEDMFPFDGVLKNMSAGNAYSKSEIKEILKLAQESHLEVIPLIQTFGHLEFALKLEQFSKLREVPNSPQALCPKRNGTLDFIREMVKQVVTLHPEVKYLHIGCDEVFQMGECELCRLELHESLFLQHITNVSTMIAKMYPSLKLIIWDDMLRHISQQTMLDVGLGKLVEPMVWVYAEDIYRFVQPLVWDKYAGVFAKVWAASAFKGAFGETQYVPDAKRHLENNLRWLDLMSHQTEDFKGGFVGLVLTGWQRYDHFAVLCETLPAGIPSLALSLTATSYGYFNASLRSKFLNGLSCPRESFDNNSPFIALDYDPYLWEKLGRCLFPGSQVFNLVYRLHSVESETKEYLRQTREQKGWLTEYNSRRNFSAPSRVEEIVSDLPRLYHNVISLVKASFEAMEGIFDNYTISEWVEQRIYPYAVQLEQIERESRGIKSVNVWPSRPLPILADIKRLVNMYAN